ncbi:hypothetical protein PTSG_13106 [Salpingoeca rosetta]|uniref:Uncharacterized protein n=1 Tax=Salpingoeca rosetta (strain ATCC 50818 / BSB-021) TaxID=946362 RepID=F2URH7_SALR5|nr:uncharacterized protein PTSG_13106 [Salpingoeca rosetta]EGD80146.1 hypothetical protein PTSG_13106 [Salpingoeca rosetta]|eukprot:XP_004988208.1 hypothetical protein PTSG_13106 [Salpingoeca rosetta]
MKCMHQVHAYFLGIPLSLPLLRLFLFLFLLLHIPLCLASLPSPPPLLFYATTTTTTTTPPPTHLSPPLVLSTALHLSPLVRQVGGPAVLCPRTPQPQLRSHPPPLLCLLFCPIDTPMMSYPVGLRTAHVSQPLLFLSVAAAVHGYYCRRSCTCRCRRQSCCC